MNMKGRAALLSVFIIVGACGKDEYKGDGTVVDQRYRAAQMTLVPITQCGGYPTMVCHVSFLPIFQPERWSIGVLADDGKGHTINVNPALWQTCTSGKRWNGTERTCT